ncbi:hypothetical protein [Microbacterium sp. YY-01]|uniref:hypothetical protein n=1 Tax=Microbacterium sp. YY-01 TaxID=3421634 RepID=UPI003D172DD2
MSHPDRLSAASTAPQDGNVAAPPVGDHSFATHLSGHSTHGAAGSHSLHLMGHTDAYSQHSPGAAQQQNPPAPVSGHFTDPGVSPLPARKNRKKIWLLCGVIIVAAGVTVGGFTLATVSAQNDYAEAHAQFGKQTKTTQSAWRELARDRATAEEYLERAAELGTIGLAQLRDDDAFDQFDSDVAALQASFDETSDLTETRKRAPQTSPGWLWEYREATGELESSITSLKSAVSTYETYSLAIHEQTSALDESGIDVQTQAHAAIPAIEKAIVDARIDDFVAMRQALDNASFALDEFTDDSVAAVLKLDTATAAFIASEKAEDAEKQGPLYETKLQVEAYARSLAPDVRIEFDWARIVNNFGDNGSAGGTATWQSAYGGYSLISLSNSVAEYWPEERMKALVAHEVGHAIASLCYDQFDWESREENEAWATAWAMSWGFNADDSGAWLYGVPSKDLQQKAKTCR